MNDTTKKAMTLEPCPFCGSSAKLFDWEHDTHGTVYSVTCENEECPIAELYADRPTEAQAIAAWNTRHRTAPRAITLSEALNTLSDFAADGGTLHSDYAYELHAAVDKMAQREGEAAYCASVQRVIDAALALISDAEEFETADGLVNAAQLHLWHALEDAIENVGRAEIINAHLSAQCDVFVDFESLGTAGPFKIVEGRITLPIVTIKDIVQMYDAVPRESEAVGEYLANVDEYGGIRWIGAKPPHGTKLYTAPPPPSVEVTEKLVKAIADKVCRYNNSRYQPWSDSNSPHYGDAEYFVRRVLESANITLPTVSDEMIDAALTAYEEFTGQEADYEGIQKALEAVLSEKGHG
jgi:hypothetical protein